MNTNVKVRETIIKVVEKLKREYRPSKIILFGSYAYGQPDGDSDIDLLIIKETKDRPIDRRVAVSRIASDPKRFIPLEVIVLTPGEVRERLEIKDQFLKEILDKGEVLYDTSGVTLSSGLVQDRRQRIETCS